MTYGWHTSTYEWHTDDMRVHTSDIRMTYEYIRVTYGWHTSTYEWHTDDIRVHTSDIRMTWHANYIDWHTDNMRFEKKNKVIFFKALFQNHWFAKEFLHAMAVLGYLIKLKMGLELTFGAHFLHGFFIQKLLI